MLQILDILFHITHLTVILINCLGWSLAGWPRHCFLLVFSFTWVSWLGFGYWYGIGYCFLTDYHWQVKRQLGDARLPPSYIHFLLEEWFHLSIPRETVDQFVACIFIVLAGIYLNFLRKTFQTFFLCPNLFRCKFTEACL